jgi:hypothetical protein
MCQDTHLEAANFRAIHQLKAFCCSPSGIVICVLSYKGLQLATHCSKDLSLILFERGFKLFCHFNFFRPGCKTMDSVET